LLRSKFLRSGSKNPDLLLETIPAQFEEMEIKVENLALELNDDVAYQKKFWVIERIFWVFLFLFIVASFLGLFGESPLGPVSIEKENLKIIYGKFLRFGDYTNIKIIIPANANPILGISKEYIENLDSISIVPFPEKNYYVNDQVKYIFMADESKPLEIAISFKAEKRGTLKGFIENDSVMIHFSQFVYP
jgi:hypothetical protein